MTNRFSYDKPFSCNVSLRLNLQGSKAMFGGPRFGILPSDE